MSYFLKRTKLKKGTYLQIYESFYDPERKASAHRSYKALGYVHELMAKGIEDPVSFYRQEAAELNRKQAAKNQGNTRQISDIPPEKYLGYFPLKNIHDSLGVKKYLEQMPGASGLTFHVFSLLSALIYSRAACLSFRHKTCYEALPRLFESYDFSLEQIYAGLEYTGSAYKNILKIYHRQIQRKFPSDTSYTYFHCLHFYSETETEESYQHQKPIISLGFLLDAERLPVGIKLYYTGETEQPAIEDMLCTLKKNSDISGRTVRLTGNKYSRTEDLLRITAEGDGYLFSLPVRELPEREQIWLLNGWDYRNITDQYGTTLYRIKEAVDSFTYNISTAGGAKKSVSLCEKRVAVFDPKLAEEEIYEINRLVLKAKSLRACHATPAEYGDSAKYITFTATDTQNNKTDSTAQAIINEEKIAEDIRLAGYTLLVTSETKRKDIDIYSAYQSIRHTEEAFRAMKSQLDARPVYMQKEKTIAGHFLICYLTELLTRLLQSKILKNSVRTEELSHFFREFRVLQITDRKYVNLTGNSPFIKDFSTMAELPLTSYYLSGSQIKDILNHRF